MSDHNPDCLHCCIKAAIEDYFRRVGERRDDKVVIDVLGVVKATMEVTVEVVGSLDSRSNRRRAMRFAHEALDAAVKAKRTGTAVAIDVPTEH